MKKILFNIFKYIGIFILLVSIALMLLVITAMIPKERIENNMKESVQFYKDNQGIAGETGHEYAFRHYYADSILLNIIYNIDTDKPLESVLWSKYYETIKIDINKDFIETVEQSKEANQQYLRYWHGSMAVLRPLFVIFNVNQIYSINKVILFGLAISLFIILFMKHKGLAITYLISLIMTTFNIVPMCFEYSWTFYIMFIVSIIIALSEKGKSDNYFCMLFFITGIITCYLDFLTTEIITYFVPMLILIALRNKEKRIGKFKNVLSLVIKTGLLWLVGYALMWVAKWGIAGAILNINPIIYVKDNLLQRVYSHISFVNAGGFNSTAVIKNFWTLYPIVFGTNAIARAWIIAGLVLIFAIVIDWNNLKGKWIAVIYLILAMAPYARYYFLTSHSWSHFFFTYRSQMITIIALGLLIMECFNYNILKKLKRKAGTKDE